MIRSTLLLLTALAAAPPPQFDLVCAGQWRFDLSDPYRPHDFTLHVDLATKRWCEGECKALRPIADVQPGAIWFEKASGDDESRGITRAQVVNRETGEYMHYQRDRSPGVIDVKASCSPAPFTPPPALQTKF